MSTEHKYRIVVETPNKTITSIWATLPTDEAEALDDLEGAASLLTKAATGDIDVLKFNCEFGEVINASTGKKFKALTTVRIPKPVLQQSLIYMERIETENID